MRAPWLPDVLRDAGLSVYVLPDAVGRGKEMFSVSALVGHDTVAGHDVQRNRVLLRDGRPGLAGPLAQLGGRPDGGVDFIADGRCNHNGYGTYANNAIGWEVYCYGGLEGKEQPWNEAQQESFVIGARAIRRYLGRDLPILGHKESDPGRKIDPYGIDMNAIRRRIEAPVPDQPTTYQEEEPMLIQMEGSPTTVFVVPGVGPRSIDNWKTDVDGLKAKGIPHIVVSKALFARIIRGHDIYGT